MAFFSKKTWKDRLVEYAGRRKITNVSTMVAQIVDVERAEGIVSEEGNALSAANMNDLEQRVADGFTSVQRTTDTLTQNLGALNDSGAIKGMDAREDGVYITYSTGADTVTKKLGNLGNTSYIQAEPTYRRVAAEFDVSDCNKILFTCKTSGSAIWFMGSNESTYVINTGTSLGFCTSSANETKEYDVSSYKYFRVEMLGSGIVQNIKFS